MHTAAGAAFDLDGHAVEAGHDHMTSHIFTARAARFDDLAGYEGTHQRNSTRIFDAGLARARSGNSGQAAAGLAALN
jgi:hypothetical protein